jgi:hypothetical protein
MAASPYGSCTKSLPRYLRRPISAILVALSGLTIVELPF